jgi:hypothetical protein
MTAKPIDTGFFQPPSFGGGGGSSSPFQQMQQGFQSTMQDIQNDPFPLLEQYLGRQAQSNIDQTLQPMQQQAQEKISGVMSGIRSLVSEAFPNSGGGGMSSGGMSTTGQLGGGSNSITQPTSPAPFTTTIPPSDMGYPAPKIGTMGGMGNFGSDLSQISTPAPLLGGGGGPPMVGGSGMGNPMAMMDAPPPVGLKAFLTSLQNQTPLSMGGPPPMMDGPMTGGTPPMGPTAPMGPPPMGPMGGPPPMGPPPMSEPAGPPPGVPPVDPSSVGLGGNPMIFQPPMTDPTTINPALTDPPMLPKMADFGPVSATIDPTVDMMEYNPAINYNVYKPAMDESGGAIDFSIVDNPAMEYNLQAPLPQQDPLINLAYNYNMENSPY